MLIIESVKKKHESYKIENKNVKIITSCGLLDYFSTLPSITFSLIAAPIDRVSRRGIYQITWVIVEIDIACNLQLLHEIIFHVILD